MHKKLALTLLGLLILQNAQAQDKPALSETDRIRLAEAFRLGEAIGDKIWKDWRKAPFAVLLVTPYYLIARTQAGGGATSRTSSSSKSISAREHRAKLRGKPLERADR